MADVMHEQGRGSEDIRFFTAIHSTILDSRCFSLDLIFLLSRREEVIPAHSFKVF